MYRYVAVLGTLVVALMAPAAAHAAVVINEVAWMGNSSNANAEWIELYNTDSTSVTLTEWKLFSSSGSPSIILTGIIEGGGYYLLERTSDESVPSIAADQIYSGALSNSGITLTLTNASGEEQDSVVGGTDWKNIGGDNTSKKTAQRMSTGWITGTGTPRALNEEGAATTDGTGTVIGDPTVSVGGTPIVVTHSATVALPNLRIEAGASRIVTAGASVPFRAVVYDTAGAQHSGAKVSWSFGDGGSETGSAVVHTFMLAGTYLVTVHATSGGAEVTTALLVRAEDSMIRIVGISEKGVTLENTGTVIADVSEWKLKGESTQFVFPEFTALMPGMPVTFIPAVTGIASSSMNVALLYPDGSVAALLEATTSEQVASTKEVSIVKDVPAISYVQPIQAPTGIQEVGKQKEFPDKRTEPIYEEATSAPSATATTGALGASVGSIVPLLKSPWTASFFGLVVAASAVLVIL